MFSAAFNNAECLEGSADPKTGSYSFRHVFGTVQANGKFGPKCNLTMSFGFLSTTTSPTGLGKGWNFKLGSYSKQSGMLVLNTGESHQVLKAYHTNSWPWELSHKLKSLEVVRHKTDSGNEEIHIRHKNGDLEVMDVDSSGDALLTSFTSANGRFLRFKYRLIQGCRHLIGVYDSDSDAKPLATVSYDNNEVITHPGTPDASTSKLYLVDGFLRKLELPGNETIRFEYVPMNVPPGSGGGNSVRIYPLQKVTYSSGATEVMEYREKLHLPARAPLGYSPAISKHTKMVATNQPPIVTTFQYDGNHNYWGGGDSGVVWGRNQDSLFNCRSKYRYSSQSKCGDKVTKCVYNKFHQVVSKVETNGNDSNKMVTNYEYYSNEHGILEDQPTTYELPKKEAIHYERGSEVSQEFVKSYQYDEWGNVTEETNACGIRTISEYYPQCPAEGEQGPTHPFGMVAFVKKRTDHPIEDNASSKTYYYTYQSISGTRAVLPMSESHDNITKTYTYFDSSTPVLQGISKSETVTINGKATTTLWDYDIKDDIISITDTVAGHDGKSLKRSRTLSFWTGLIHSEIDEKGVVTAYTRDRLGRLLSETTGVNTEYEVKTTYKYEEPKGNQWIGLKVEQVTATGATVHTYYDAEHMELAAYQQDEHSIMRKLSEKQYDDQGRLISESDLDYIISETGELEKTLCEKTAYKYDTWGNKSETRHDNGTIEIETKDPIALTTTKQTVYKDDQSSLHKEVTTQNKHGNHIATEIFTPDGKLYSKSTFTYDTFGRKTSFTTPAGHTARLTKYDQLDRPVEFEHYDGTTFKVSYADFSTEHLVSSISVPSFGVTLGEREYDGLSRIISSTVNGAKTRFGYKGGQDRPSSCVNAKGNTTLFDYIPELNMQVSRVASFTYTVSDEAWGEPSKVSESSFTYSKNKDASHGSILSATASSNSQYSYSYTNLGFVKAVTQVVGKHSKTLTNLKTTIANKPLSVKFDDRIISYEYDEFGDVVSTTDGDIKVELQEDNFGRLSSKVVKQFNPETKSYDLVQTTLTSYDEHSREVARTISVKRSGVTVTLKSEYDEEDKLVRRITVLNDVDSLTESFDYDSKKRLLKHTTSNCKADIFLPRNENGKPFVSQSFAFDGLDNITTIETSFPNREINKATFTYDSRLKQRLSQISHTLTSGENAYPKKLTFEYDADGHLVSFNGSKMTYTVSGRLSKMGATNYAYDACDRLIQSDKTVHFYLGQDVVQEFDGTSTTNIIRCGDVPICEIQNGRKKFYGVDHKLSVVSVTDDSSRETMFTNYSSYGCGESSTRIGFNGGLRDVGDNGVYFLGNGTRAYFPGFCGFSSADTFSPFYFGGINPFKYACGNPISAIDPSGHISVWEIIGTVFGAAVAVAALIAIPFTGGSSTVIAIGVISGILGVTSSGLEIGAEIAEENGDHDLANKLTISSYAFGAASLVVGLGQGAASIGKVAKAGIAAKAAAKTGKMKVFAKAGDRFVTTGYTSKIAVRFRRYVPKDQQAFTVFKMKNGKVTGKFLKNRLVWENKKYGIFYVRKTRLPVRVTKGGNYAGMKYVLRKRATLAIGLSASRVGGLIYKTTKFGINQYEEEHPQEDNRSMDTDTYTNFCSAYGLPMTPKRHVGVEGMLFSD